jgi:hypothetical protein
MREADDNRGFTIVTLAGDYRFETERDQQPRGSWLKDFAHTRRVKQIRSYEYSGSTLPATHFQIYQAAICEIAAGHQFYNDFDRFVKQYLSDIA